MSWGKIQMNRNTYDTYVQCSVLTNIHLSLFMFIESNTFVTFLRGGVKSLPPVVPLGKVRASKPALIPNMEVPGYTKQPQSVMAHYYTQKHSVMMR